MKAFFYVHNHCACRLYLMILNRLNVVSSSLARLGVLFKKKKDKYSHGGVYTFFVLNVLTLSISISYIQIFEIVVCIIWYAVRVVPFCKWILLFPFDNQWCRQYYSKKHNTFSLDIFVVCIWEGQTISSLENCWMNSNCFRDRSCSKSNLDVFILFMLFNMDVMCRRYLLYLKLEEKKQ